MTFDINITKSGIKLKNLNMTSTMTNDITHVKTKRVRYNLDICESLKSI